MAQAKTLVLRDGLPEDAAIAMGVIRRSITELCGLDHRFDREEIADWIASKTPAAWLAWIARRDARVVVALRGVDIVGVGMVDQGGKILVNYVCPDARFSGVSDAIMTELEQAARTFGAQSCDLKSTRTAMDFYLRRGYIIEDAAEFRMRKTL